VRGPRSRKARDAEGEADAGQLSAPRKAAEVAKALKKATKAAASARVKAVAKTAQPKGAKKKAVKAAPAGTKAQAKKAAKAETAKPDKVVLKADRTKPAKTAAPAKAATKQKAQTKTKEKDQKDPQPAKRAKTAKKSTAEKGSGKAKDAPKAAKATRATKATKKTAGTARPLDFRAAIDTATEEVLEPVDHGVAAKPRRRRRTEPPPAVNEPLAFINFVAANPLGSAVEGVVASFTSHGAMVEVPLPEGGVLHCYAPLTGLGVPPPRAAREVLRRGERRQFTLVGLDPPRRMAELALPEYAPSFLRAKSQGPRQAG